MSAATTIKNPLFIEGFFYLCRVVLRFWKNKDFLVLYIDPNPFSVGFSRIFFDSYGEAVYD